jgi:anthranilate phosphoribosyltransferase
MIQSAIEHVEAGRDLSMDEVLETFDLVMSGRCNEEDIARWLLALNRKGPSVSEVAGAAVALRRKMTPIRSSRPALLDTCGTGGDQLNTFNISTAAALVTAAAGVPVAKHGNRAASSRSGSADVLSTLGVNIEADVACVERCLDELGICFCFAPLLHNAMRHVAPVRKKLGVPTIFNVLGPLINPAGASRQLMGVGQAKLRPLLADALVLLGTARSVVVHGSDGLDEVTLTGPTAVTEAAGKARDFQWAPADFELERIEIKSIQVAGPDQSAQVIRDVLAGQRGPARDIVLANAAAALWTAGAASTPAAGVAVAAESIDSSAARDLLVRLAACSHGK